MSTAFIDLGELPPRGHPGPGSTAADGAVPWRTVLGVFGVILLFLLGGAGYRPPPAGPATIPAQAADSKFISGNRLFVVSAGEDPFGSAIHNKIISTYELPSGKLRTRTGVAVTGAIFDVFEVGDTILVSYQVDTVGAEATVALDAGTDHARWRHPARLLSVSQRDGLVLLRENSPQVGNLHWYGIDLASGKLRWALDQPVFGLTIEARDADGFPTKLITVSINGHLEVRQPSNGRVTAAADIKVPPDWKRDGISMWTADNLVLLGGNNGTTAYDLDRLRKVWSNPVDLSERYVLPHCTDAVCVVGTFDGVEVLDPRTGRTRWSSKDWGGLEQLGAYLLADGPVGGIAHPQAVLDPRTGRRLGDFGSWRVSGGERPDGAVVGLRQDTAKERVWYAILNPATRAIRVLGAADDVSGDCETTDDVLVCRRLDASIGLWRLN